MQNEAQKVEASVKDSVIRSGVVFGLGLALAIAGNVVVRRRPGETGAVIAGAVACGVGAIVMGHAITELVFMWPTKILSRR